MDEDQRAALGALVRRARKTRQWSINEMAEAAGVAPGTANNVELGRKVRPGNLRTVLDAVGIDPLAKVDGPEPVDKRITFAVDIVRKWLEALPEDEVDPAVIELTRFAMLRD